MQDRKYTYSKILYFSALVGRYISVLGINKVHLHIACGVCTNKKISKSSETTWALALLALLAWRVSQRLRICGCSGEWWNGELV